MEAAPEVAKRDEVEAGPEGAVAVSNEVEAPLCAP